MALRKGGIQRAAFNHRKYTAEHDDPQTDERNETPKTTARNAATRRAVDDHGIFHLRGRQGMQRHDVPRAKP